MIDAARNAAKVDNNSEAATLFERAIRHNVNLGPSVLREYADQLVYTQRANTAVPLYQEVLANQATSDPDRLEAKLGLALAMLQTSQPAEAYKLYNDALSHEVPGTENYRKTQRGLSLALTWAGMPDKALAAWREYLKTVPNDADAIIHQAQVLSSLHQDQKALETYKYALSIDRRSDVARRGTVDETVKLARIAAQSDRNAALRGTFRKCH